MLLPNRTITYSSYRRAQPQGTMLKCHMKRNKIYQGPGLLVYISIYVQLWFLFILLFVVKIHYLFRPNWPSSGVQIGIKMWAIPTNTHEYIQLGRNM
jgi:hypothetical protein